MRGWTNSSTMRANRHWQSGNKRPWEGDINFGFAGMENKRAQIPQAWTNYDIYSASSHQVAYAPAKWYVETADGSRCSVSYATLYRPLFQLWIIGLYTYNSNVGGEIKKTYRYTLGSFYTSAGNRVIRQVTYSDFTGDIWSDTSDNHSGSYIKNTGTGTVKFTDVFTNPDNSETKTVEAVISVTASADEIQYKVSSLTFPDFSDWDLITQGGQSLTIIKKLAIGGNFLCSVNNLGVWDASTEQTEYGKLKVTDL